MPWNNIPKSLMSSYIDHRYRNNGRYNDGFLLESFKQITKAVLIKPLYMN